MRKSIPVLMLLLALVCTVTAQDQPDPVVVSLRVQFADGRWTDVKLIEVAPDYVRLMEDHDNTPVRHTYDHFSPESAVEIKWWMTVVGTRPDLVKPDVDDPLGPGETPVDLAAAGVTIEFIDGRTATGTLHAVEEEGVMLTAESEGDDGIPVLYEWRLISEKSRAKLLAWRGIRPVDEQKTRFAGSVYTLRDGTKVRGKELNEFSTAKDLVIKTGPGAPLRISRQEIVAGPEKVTLTLKEIYSAEEIERILAHDLSPKSPDYHERLALALAREGLKDKAAEQFEIAAMFRRQDLPENKVYRQILQFRDRVDDWQIKEQLHTIGQRIYNREWDMILAQISDISDRIEDASYKTEMLRIRNQVVLLKQRSIETQTREHYQISIDALLRRTAIDPEMSLAEAEAFVDQEMVDEAVKRVGDRTGLDPDSIKSIWDSRRRTDVSEFSYENASWLVENPTVADREAWWKHAGNNGRYYYLKGRYIEEHLAVVEVVQKQCPECGGDGTEEREGTYGHPMPRSCQDCLTVKFRRVLLYY